MEESAITDLPSSDVREDKVEESLKEDRREAMIPDKEVCNRENIKIVCPNFPLTTLLSQLST